MNIRYTVTHICFVIYIESRSRLSYLYRKFKFFKVVVSMRKNCGRKNHKYNSFQMGGKIKVVHCNQFCNLANISLESDIYILYSLLSLMPNVCFYSSRHTIN